MSATPPPMVKNFKFFTPFKRKHLMSQPIIPNRVRAFEVSAIIATAIGKFVFMDWLDWRFPFIAIAISVWIGYVIFRSRKMADILPYWGFRFDNFGKALKIILPFALVAVALSVGIGLYLDTIIITWHILPLLILYPIWGTIQQFLLIALTAGNLMDWEGSKVPKWVSILLSAVLFGLIHYPFVWLMVGTFGLAIFYGFVFGKVRNIYALGIFHGWLAAVFYYTVVGRDPFLETFGRLLGIQ